MDGQFLLTNLQGDPSGWLLAFVDTKVKVVFYYKESKLWQNFFFWYQQKLVINLTGHLEVEVGIVKTVCRQHWSLSAACNIFPAGRSLGAFWSLFLAPSLSSSEQNPILNFSSGFFSGKRFEKLKKCLFLMTTDTLEM